MSQSDLESTTQRGGAQPKYVPQPYVMLGLGAACVARVVYAAGVQLHRTRGAAHTRGQQTGTVCCSTAQLN